MKPVVLPLSDSRADLESVGGKGISLAKLIQAGFPIPDGFHITTEAYRQFIAANDLQPKILAALHMVEISLPATLETTSQTIREFFDLSHIPADLSDAIVDAYQAQGEEHAVVAVRSSATAEDLPDASFAGQQETYLNIHGIDALLDAVKKCWGSLWTARAIAYRIKNNIDQTTIALAVVVQEMVDAEAAGILFTANHINGRRDEMIINASWGLGEAIVGGLVSPDTIVAEKATGKIKQYDVAEKTVITVRTDKGTREDPLDDTRRSSRVLNEADVVKLVNIARRIESFYGKPQDIEWCHAGGRFYIVQSRPVTALPKAPIEWIPPKPKGVYMRGSIVDLMPDPVSPLFATLGISSITRVGIKQVLEPLTRSKPILPDDYITTINEYAYMCASFTPRQMWWILFRMMASFPRLLREALPLWRDKIRPQYAKTVAQWQDRPLEAMGTADLWAGTQEVIEAAMLHMASLLVATTGASAGSEMLFTRVYEKMIRREADPAASVFLMGYNSTPILAEKSLYDLAKWVHARPELAARLLGTPSAHLAIQLADLPHPQGNEAGAQEWLEFRQHFQVHLRSYGHIIYDVDFAKPLPLDNPAPMLETIKMYLRGEGADPHERQRLAEEKRIQSADATLNRLRGLKRWAFRKTLGMAQAMAQVRENALADIGLGYPLLRRMLCELGRRFTQAGIIAQAQDIFWLKVDEVGNATMVLEHGESSGSLGGRVTERQVTHEELKGVTPPPMLPPRKKYMGIDMGTFTPATEESQTEGKLKGIAASTGRVTAPACVLRDMQDFERMRPGDVLVAAATTPAWTPLFAMASAVVTDIGGPLSHGSIVAREYGIPAVMGTGIATKRIKNGQVITVDGYAGVVTIE